MLPQATIWLNSEAIALSEISRRRKRTKTARFHSHELPTVKVIGTERTRVIGRVRGEEGNEALALEGSRASVEARTKLWKWIVVAVAQRYKCT